MLSFRRKHISENCRLLLILIVMLVGMSEVKGQTSNIYAAYVGTPPANSGGTIGAGGTGPTSPNGSYSITNETNINDLNYANFATLTALSGQGGGLFGTTGGISTAYINLNFTGSITPKTGTSIAIKLTASTLSAVQVQAYNSGVPVGAAQTLSALAIRAADEYVFIAPGDCNSIRITISTGVGNILGGTSTNSSNVYYAYVLDPNCSPVNYTNTRKTTVIDLGSNIANAANAIDGNLTTFSLFSNGLGVGTTLYQTVYFSQLSKTGDVATLTLSIPPAALSAGILGYTNLNTYNGSTLVSNTAFSGLLLGTDLLTLLNSGAPTTISIAPPLPFDRVEIAMSSLLSLATSLNLYEVKVTPAKPTFSPVALQNLTICPGTNVTLTPVPPSAGNEHRWYSSLTATTPLVTANTYTPSPALTASTTYYVATAKTGCTAESERVPVTITVNTITGGTVAANQTLCPNTIPTAFTSIAAATIMAGGTAATYQWQKSTDNVNFSDIPSATGLTYTETIALTATTYYRRVATSSLSSTSCSANSNVIIVTINSINGGTVSTNQTLCSNTIPAAFTSAAAATIIAGGTSATYQWQKSFDNVNFTNIPSATGVTYIETVALTATTYYRRVASSTLNGTSCSANSNVITVTVNLITAGTIVANQTICHGEVPATFTTTGGSGTGVMTYQWQKSVDNTAFNNISGATNQTYTETAALNQTTYYRRIDTSTLNTVICTAITNHLTITINPKPLSPHVTIITNSQY
jgi:hypothetical protein